MTVKTIAAQKWAIYENEKIKSTEPVEILGEQLGLTDSKEDR